MWFSQQTPKSLDARLQQPIWNDPSKDTYICLLGLGILNGLIWETNLCLIGWIILNNPIDLWDVQPPGCHICTQQNAISGVAELEESL